MTKTIYFVENYRNGDHYGYASIAKAKDKLNQMALEALSVNIETSWRWRDVVTVEQAKELAIQLVNNYVNNVTKIDDEMWIEDIGYIEAVDVDMDE